MATSVLRADCNLLPWEIAEVGLGQDEAGGWLGYCAYRAGRQLIQKFDFPGGRNPESWLAFKLERDYKFATMAASEAAKRLFRSFQA